MGIESFAEKIKVYGSGKSWILLLVSYFITVLASGDNSQMHWDCVYAPLIGMLCCYAFYENYLRIPRQDADITMGFDHIVKYTVYHGFSTKAYFSYIMKKFLPIQTAMAVWALLAGIIEKNQGQMLLAAVVFLLPFLVWQIKKEACLYAITHRSRRIHAIFVGAGGLILEIASLYIVEVTFCLGIFLVYALVQSWLIPQDDRLISICFCGGAMGAFYVVGVFWPLTLFFDGKFIRKYHIKKIVTFAMALLFALSLWRDVANHTIIEGERILVSRNFSQREYRFDEIRKIEAGLDEKEANLEICLTCVDGEKICFSMSGTIGMTDAWQERYDNEYEYFQDLVLALEKQGSETKIRKTELDFLQTK